MKRVVFGCILLVMLSFLLQPSLQAQAKPQSFNCTGSCTSKGWWNGKTYGAFTDFTLSRPSLSYTSGVFDRYLDVRVDSSHSYPRIDMGEEVRYGIFSPGACTGYNTGLYIFVQTTDDLGNSTSWCYADDNSDDVNHGLEVQEGNYVSNGGGNLIRLWSVSQNWNVYWPYDEGAQGFYGTIGLYEIILDDVSGHEVWGSSWTLNKWSSSDGVYHYQTRDFDYRYANNPPQFYWNDVPVPGNNGGELYSCDYDTGSTCTFGK
jgi:hypothetical protein